MRGEREGETARPTPHGGTAGLHGAAPHGANGGDSPRRSRQAHAAPPPESGGGDGRRYGDEGRAGSGEGAGEEGAAGPAGRAPLEPNDGEAALAALWGIVTHPSLATSPHLVSSQQHRLLQTQGVYVALTAGGEGGAQALDRLREAVVKHLVRCGVRRADFSVEKASAAALAVEPCPRDGSEQGYREVTTALRAALAVPEQGAPAGACSLGGGVSCLVSRMDPRQAPQEAVWLAVRHVPVKFSRRGFTVAIVASAGYVAVDLDGTVLAGNSGEKVVVLWEQCGLAQGGGPRQSHVFAVIIPPPTDPYLRRLFPWRMPAVQGPGDTRMTFDIQRARGVPSAFMRRWLYDRELPDLWPQGPRVNTAPPGSAQGEAAEATASQGHSGGAGDAAGGAVALSLIHI